MITGILLAAGKSHRFGRNKLLVKVGAIPLICHSLKNCVASQLPEVTVVLGSRSEEMEEAIGRFLSETGKVKTIVNEDHERGMMSSLKMGIRSVDPGCSGAMVLLADMPLVTPDIIDRLIEVFEENDRIIIPECEGTLYHPRILPARIFPDFLRLADTDKGTKVLEDHREEILQVRTGSRMNYVDIDRIDDLDSVVDS